MAFEPIENSVLKYFCLIVYGGMLSAAREVGLAIEDSGTTIVLCPRRRPHPDPRTLSSRVFRAVCFAISNTHFGDTLVRTPEKAGSAWWDAFTNIV